jgi:outer membrane protein OmpA-like peptidoglycan-associated protein
VSNSDIPKQPPDNTDDWGKTNYKHPAQPPADDWGSTVTNVRRDDIDFNKTQMPGANNPQGSDWGNTQGNIKLPQDVNYGSGQEDFGGRSGGGDNDYGATTPYFRLPDAERAKYQNVPPTPTQEAEQRRQEEKAKGGVPGWLWVSGGLLAMFLFAVFSLLVVYVFILRDSGFEQIVKGAPQGSSILVNGAYWGTTSDDGTIILPTLRAGETKKVEIKHPNWVCEAQDIKGEDGVKREPIIARCKQVANISNDCINIKAGAYDTAERCANKALDELAPEFTVDDLLRAMNLYIIQFDSGKFDIPPRNMVFLGRAAGFMKKLPPTAVVEVGGHTDSDGSDTANQSLSENRAKAVREALMKFGIAPEMLTEKGYGEAKPKTTNNTDDGKFQNRRIEYTAVKK